MPTLTGLTSTVKSSWTDNQSLMLHVHHDDNDYKIAPGDLETIIGISGGCCINNYAGQSVTQDVNTDLLFTSICYEEGTGWQNLVNSATYLMAPKRGVYGLSADIGVAGGGVGCEALILHEATRNNTPMNYTRWENSGSEQRHVMSHPIAADSGDIFTLSFRNHHNTQSVNNVSFYIWPMGYI